MTTATAAMEARDDVVKVRRDGGRGWHWIWRAAFDPAVHELLQPPEPAAPTPETAPTPDKPRRGRPPKHQPE